MDRSYSGDIFLGRVGFALEGTNPTAVFDVSLGHLNDLRAVEHCNMHGTWGNKKEL